MKTIGLLGGMSWESTASYYQIINRGVSARLGGWHSAKIALYSVDFQEIETLMRAGDWDKTAERLIVAARRVEAAGADFLLICTNTMHIVAPRIEKAVWIPLLHIVDATARKIEADGLGRTVGLIGTAPTMEEPFYRDRLKEQHGVDTLIPEAADRQTLHRIIFDELCLGKIRESSRKTFLRIIEDLRDRGAGAVVLGCTEIGLLVEPSMTEVPLLDTTRLHAEAAVEMALA